MNSILDSISTGDLQVPQIPRDTSVKKDSIIDLLNNSEIELTTCHKTANKLENINTGFGNNNELHYEDQCSEPELKKPLYKENYFSEFETKEEKAAARHALGLYNAEDVMDMTLLTAKDTIPTNDELQKAVIKSLFKKDEFFSPTVLFKSVYDTEGVSLESKMLLIDKDLESIHQNMLSFEKIGEIKN